MAQLFKFSTTGVLVAGLLLAQWMTLVPSAPAHAPLHECGRHQCGCPAEMTARKVCCCFDGEADATPGVVETLIRSAQCGGDAAPRTVALAKLHWIMPVFEPVVRTVGLSDDVVDNRKMFPTRVVEPAVPPPKLLPRVEQFS